MIPPLVSIIMPCYNKQAYIEEALASIEWQTYTHWELVLVDDGSPDDTLGTALRYITAHRWEEGRVVALKQENQGPSVARNNGIRHSHGKYILPLDPDDIILPTFLQKAVAIMEQPGTTLVYSQMEIIGRPTTEADNQPYSFDSLIWRNMIPNTALYRRHDYDCTQGYNPNMRHGLEDWDFYLSLLNTESPVARIDEPLYQWRNLPQQRTTEADAHERELFRQIYHNHPHLYTPYLHDIIYYHEKCTHHANAVAQVRQSHAYRLGKMLLKPLQWLRRKQG